MLNLQLTSSYFHNDVTQFLYGENEFYFRCPHSLEHFLLCLQGGPFNVNPVRPLGAVILDLRRRTSCPREGHAWPVIPSDTSNCNCTTTDWDEHLGRLPKFTSTWLLRCHELVEGKKKKKARAGEKEVERWADAVSRLLDSITIGKFVLRGDPDWCSILFSTSPLVKALLKFKGQGRVSQVHQAGRWPRGAEVKVLQMLKDTLEEEAAKGSESKHRRTIQSKKRKRVSKAAMDTLVDAAPSDGE